MLSFFKQTARHSVSVEMLNEILKNPDACKFIDVREQHEWDEDHIDGFTHIPLAMIPLHITEFKNCERIFFICRSGGRSGTACDILKAEGITSAHNVEGGMRAWESAGFPISA